MTQVRLEADVAEALRQLAGDASVAQLANRKLRSALGLDKPASAPSERRSTIRSPTSSTTFGGRTLLTRGVEFDSASCPHPLSRRIGNACAVCGTRMKGNR